MEKRFNLRVYGLYLTEQKEILVTDEFEKGIKFTKFPGGGLEYGEGTIDCLKREFLEEMNQPIEVVKHFYTTDFFQQSAFNRNDQLISIYYFVKLLGERKFTVKERQFDFVEQKEGAHSFRLIPLEKLQPEELMFPIDKKVLAMLKGEV
jgi:8-oxo-dGTP diphosphatase